MADLEIQKKYIDRIAKYKTTEHPDILFDSLRYTTLDELENIVGLYLIAELFDLESMEYKYEEDSSFDYASKAICLRVSFLAKDYFISKLEGILTLDQLNKLDNDFFEEFL